MILVFGKIQLNYNGKFFRKRCQLRIFGWHTDNVSELPVTDLPWAQPMYPINNSKSFSVPRLGDWVVGFFMDGDSGQAPIMMGVLPGIQK